MWKIPLCCVLVAYICQKTQAAELPAGAATGTTPIPIIKYENDGVNHDGSYKWSYQTGNEIEAEESGYQLPEAPEQGGGGHFAQGSYSYTAPDGSKISMSYTAGPNGFVPVGDHIPTPPPIPAAIAKALEYLKSLPPSAEDSPAEASNDIAQVVPPQPSLQPQPQPKQKLQYRSIFYKQ